MLSFSVFGFLRQDEDFSVLSHFKLPQCGVAHVFHQQLAAYSEDTVYNNTIDTVQNTGFLSV